MNSYPIKFISVLPFNLPNITPSEGSFQFEGNSVIYKIFSKENIREAFILDYTEGNHNAVISIKFNQNHNFDKADAFNYYTVSKNRAKIVQKSLRYLNRFLLLLKYNSQNEIRLSNVRSVGEIDLLIYKIKFDSDSTLEGRLNRTSVNKFDEFELNFTEFSDEISNEWSLLIKAQDLINHGFYKEGLILGFSLLDHLSQEFIKIKMDGFTEDEKDDLIRGIEKSRLRRYLGVLMKLLIGESYLEIDGKEKKLTWLNKKRNEIMHNGDSCKFDDAKEGMEIIIDILVYLKSKGMELEFPRLRFWTNE